MHVSQYILLILSILTRTIPFGYGVDEQTLYAGDKFGIIHEGDIMEFQISIDQFEGPLDLMLHLIKTNKLDLMDLDMNTLATQYIAYIAQMKQLQLEIASEYLSELASLIEYKSRKLLPRSEVAIEEEYEEDQREKLVSRLIEYQKYKDVCIFQRNLGQFSEIHS